MNIEHQMDNFEKKLLKMGSETRIAMHLSRQALISQDNSLALNIVENDQRINYAEENINDEAIQILTLMQPVAKDLRMLIGGIKIANDLERIGDYAKNIARFVIQTKIIDKEVQKQISNLMDLFLQNFDQCLNILEDRTLDAAYHVASLDDALDLEFKEFVSFLTKGNDQAVEYPFDLVNIARNIERAGDHSKNICEQIIYIIKGSHIDFG